jgi:hypothetical protein
MMKKNKNKGSSLIVTFLVLSIVLIAALSVALITVKERNASIGSVKSSKAYQLADEGIEKVMQLIIYGNNNYINKSGEDNLSEHLDTIEADCDGATGLIVDKGGNYSVELFDRDKNKINCDDSDKPVLDIDVIKSIGYDGNTSRAISAPISFLNKDLIAYWRMNEGEGSTAYDWTRGGGENIGQLSSGASFSDGSTDVLSVDIPEGEYVDVDGLLGEPASLTLSAWVKLNTIGINGSDIISLGNAAGIRLNDVNNGSSVVGFYYNGTDLNFTSSDVTLSDSDWHMITYTIDNENSEQRVYIDGQQEGSSSTHSDSIDYSGQGGDTLLGVQGDDDPNYNFEGEMREIRAYSRALSEDEISLLYNISRP